MTFTHAKRIAAALKNLRPDPATATVAERALWGRLACSLLHECMLLTTANYWDHDAWREAAGMEPEPEPDDEWV